MLDSIYYHTPTPITLLSQLFTFNEPSNYRSQELIDFLLKQKVLLVRTFAESGTIPFLMSQGWSGGVLVLDSKSDDIDDVTAFHNSKAIKFLLVSVSDAGDVVGVPAISLRQLVDEVHDLKESNKKLMMNFDDLQKKFDSSFKGKGLMVDPLEASGSVVLVDSDRSGSCGVLVNTIVDSYGGHAGGSGGVVAGSSGGGVAADSPSTESAMIDAAK